MICERPLRIREVEIPDQLMPPRDHLARDLPAVSETGASSLRDSGPRVSTSNATARSPALSGTHVSAPAPLTNAPHPFSSAAKSMTPP